MAKRRAQIEVTLRDRASAGLKRLGGVATGLSKAFGLVTAAATTIGTVLGARFLFGAIQSAGDFDEAMRTVQAVTRASTEELQLLREAANEAGATTRFTATEAANGLEELARAGFDANQAVQALNPSLQLAAGNNQTVAESALQITTALNAFGLSADEAARVSDVYTRAAQRSAQTTQQLGEAMTFVAPVARQAGIDIETTAALVGRLADAGFRASLGGTALRNAILQFQDPASNFRKELSALGIETDDFVVALEELAGAGSGAGAAIRALGLRAGPAIQAIVAGGAPALRELTEELRNSAGASDQAAAALEDNLPGALRSFKSAYDAARRALVEPLVGRITEELQEFTIRLRDFVSSGRIDQFAELLKDGFDTALGAVKEFIAGVDFDQVTQRINDFVSNSQTKLGEFREASASLVAGFDRLVGGINVTVGVLRSAFNVLGVAIGTAVQLAAKSVERFLSIINFFTAGQISFVQRARQELEDTVASFKNTTDQFSIALGDALGQTEEGWRALVESFEAGGVDIERTLNDIGANVDSGIAEPSARAKENLQALKDAMVEAGFDARLFGEEAQEAGEKVEGLAESFEAVTGDFGNGIETKVIPKIQSIGNAAEESVEKVEESLSKTESGFDGVGRSAGRARSSVEEVASTSEQASASAAGLSASIAGMLGSLRSLSDGANESVERWVQNLPRLQTVEGFFQRLAKFSDELVRSFEEQSETADDLIRRYEDTGDAISNAGQAAQLLSSELTLLDSQRLAALRGVISDARRETEDFLDSVTARNEQLREEVAKVRGEEEELYALRDAERIKEIEDQIRRARNQSGQREVVKALQEQLRLERQLQEEKRQQEANASNSLNTERQRTQELEKAANAAEREANARSLASDNVNRSVVEVVARVEAGEVTFSEADLARITQRIISQLQREQQRT